MDQPTISISQMQEDAKKRIQEIEGFWSERGYQRTPDGKWMKVDTQEDEYKSQLDVKSKELDVLTKTKALAKEDDPMADIPAEQQKKLISIQSSGALIKDIESYLNSKKFDTGRSQSAKGLMRKLFGPTFPGLGQSDEEQKFNISSTALLNTYIQALSGAQTSPQEAERLGLEIPKLTDTRQEIKNKLAVMKKKLEDQRNAISNVTGATTSQGDEIDSFLEGF